LVGVIIVVSLFSVLAQYKVTQIASSTLAGRIQELNEALGQAISMVQGADGGEHPLVSVAKIWKDFANQNPIVSGHAKVIEKDESGKFVKKIE